MTTSSLILNALVCLAIAAVRARSSQNFLRLSGDTRRSPRAADAARPHDLARRARDRVVDSPTMSPISTIFGRPWRFALVA
jgi:hypothetical protein